MLAVRADHFNQRSRTRLVGNDPVTRRITPTIEPSWWPSIVANADDLVEQAQPPIRLAASLDGWRWATALHRSKHFFTVASIVWWCVHRSCPPLPRLQTEKPPGLISLIGSALHRPFEIRRTTTRCRPRSSRIL